MIMFVIEIQYLPILQYKDYLSFYGYIFVLIFLCPMFSIQY